MIIVIISQFWQIYVLMEPKLCLDNKEEQKQVLGLSDKCLYPPKKSLVYWPYLWFLKKNKKNNVQQALINSFTSQTKVYDLGIEKSQICQFHLWNILIMIVKKTLGSVNVSAEWDGCMLPEGG